MQSPLMEQAPVGVQLPPGVKLPPAAVQSAASTSTHVPSERQQAPVAAALAAGTNCIHPQTTKANGIHTLHGADCVRERSSHLLNKGRLLESDAAKK